MAELICAGRNVALVNFVLQLSKEHCVGAPPGDKKMQKRKASTSELKKIQPRPVRTTEMVELDQTVSEGYILLYLYGLYYNKLASN